MSLKFSNLNQETSKKIFDHWKSIPAFKIYSPESYKFANQEIRSLILDILREGQEETLTNDLKAIRHVFTVKEIYRFLKTKTKQRLKLSIVYFHLNELEKQKYISIITSVNIGRHKVNYYGRSARLYLFIDKSSNKILESKEYQTYKRIIQYFNPELPETEISTLFQNYQQLIKGSYDRIEHWIETNCDLLVDANCDFRDIYNFLHIIDNYNPSIVKLHSEFAKLFNFPTE
ncbi:MAG: hypothetical protein ACXAC7_18145 [Candidatus Hodarchaeales archaeon]